MSGDGCHLDRSARRARSGETPHLSPTDRSRCLRERGFTLVALMVVLIVLNIAVATAMQIWSKVAQREKEEELIFRGLQYAEGIRVFQQRFGRPPTTLEEMMEVRPRVIRQLWKDPLSPTGAWEPILAGSGTDVTELAGGNAPGQAPRGAPGQARGQRPGQGGGGFGAQQQPGARRRGRGAGEGRPQSGFGQGSGATGGRAGGRQGGAAAGGGSGFDESGFGGSGTGEEGGESGELGTGEQLSQAFDEAAGFSSGPGNSSFGRNARETQIGALEGVKPTATGSAMKQFLGRGEYSSWEFRASMLAEPRVSPEGVPLTPRLDPSALGRPFPEWMTGVEGSSPHPAEGDTPEEWLPEESDDF